MGQCLSGESAYERTEYKYQPYDWLGELSKDKDKLKASTDKPTEAAAHCSEVSTKQPADSTNPTNIVNISVNVTALPGADKNQFVFTTNQTDLTKLGHISFAFTMGQCTSVQKSDHSIEEEPYSVARRSEPEVTYRSRYEPYIWDSYVDTDDQVRKKDRSKSYDSLKWDVYAQPEKVKKKKPVKEEKRTYGSLYDPNLDDTNDSETPGDRGRPGESLYDPNRERTERTKSPNEATERGRRGDSFYEPNVDKTPYTSIDYSTDTTIPIEGTRRDDAPSHTTSNVEEETPRQLATVTYNQPDSPRRHRVVNVGNVDTPRKQIADSNGQNDTLIKPTADQVKTEETPRKQTIGNGEIETLPRRPIVINGEIETLPRRPIVINGEIETLPRRPIVINGETNETPRKPTTRNGNSEETPPKYIPVNIEIEDVPRKRNARNDEIDQTPLKRVAIHDETDDTPRKHVASSPDPSDEDEDDYNDDITLDERHKKDAPPNYRDVVPVKTTSVIRYDSVSLPNQPTEDEKPSDKQKRVLKPEKPEESKYLYKPKPSDESSYVSKPNISDRLNDSSEKKEIESPTMNGDNTVPEKIKNTQPLVKPDLPKTMSPSLTNGIPNDKKEKTNPNEELSPTVLMKNPIHVRNVGTRPEKSDIKATVLLPTKFPQLFSGKRNAWRGLLLFGPAGSGKASLATAVAKEIGHSYCTLRNFITLNNFNGNSVAAMFKKARDDTPHVIIIDHLDGLTAAEIRELHKQMKSSTDEQFEGLLVVGISDSPWLLDKAVIELFEKRLFITLPSAASRAELFRENFEHSPHSLSEEDFIELGAWSEGYTCADIITVVNETRMHLLRKIQEATYFRKISSKDPETSRYIDLYTPCSPGEKGAIEMDWTRVPEKKLQEPHIRLCDVLVALRTQKPSLNPDDIEKHKQFAKRFTQHS